MNNPLTVEPAKAVTIHSLAVEHYRAAEGNIAEARTAIIALLSENQELLAEIVDAAIRSAMSTALNVVATNHRNRISKAAATPPATGRANVVALATGLAAGYLDWPLANGIKLRNATRADLTESINRYSSMASSLQGRAQWLQLILQSMPEDAKTVGDRLTEARLSELFKEVSKS